MIKKEPFIVGTAIRTVKTPSATVARKLLNKVACQSVGQPIRVKVNPSHLLQSSSPPVSIATEVPIYPPVSNNEQSLDFSLLNTIKNVCGQMKV